MSKKVIKKRLFFDIETSPNIGFFWDSSRKIFLHSDNILFERKIICISWKWSYSKKVYHATWDKDKDDKKMLETFVKCLWEADEVIAHNGDRFDLPWIRTRCLIHGIECPVIVTSTDTYKKAKYYFKLNSNKLSYIADLLGCSRKGNTEYQWWKDLMWKPYSETEDIMKAMVEYCDQDILVLEEVFEKLKNYIDNTTHYGVLNGQDKWTCPECSSKKVRIKTTRVTKAGTQKKQMNCKKCGKYYQISMKSYSDYLAHKIQKNSQVA